MSTTSTATVTEFPAAVEAEFDAVFGHHACVMDAESLDVNLHFPGGRYDAYVKPDGSWRLVRMDFTRPDGTSPTTHPYPETIEAEGRGAKALADVLNPAIDRRTNGIPVVGGPATYTIATDSYACTVIAVERKGTRVTLRRDKATLLNGAGSGEPDALKFEPGGFFGHTSGEARYAYEPDPNGETYVVTRRVRKNGDVAWKAVGHNTNSSGLYATFLGRAEHYDSNY
jgi:hypothetical protein